MLMLMLMPLSLSLQFRFAGPPLSGKSSAYDRFLAPLIEGMQGCRRPWRFGNVTTAALHRKLRRSAVWIVLGGAEGSRFLRRPLGRAFSDLNDLSDGNVPAFDRADDDDHVANAPDSAIFVSPTNVQNGPHSVWCDKYAQGAIESGCVFRVLMMARLESIIAGRCSSVERVLPERLVKRVKLLTLVVQWRR
ncbi:MULTISPECIES: hypothetical protein [Burkholderia cepacia complex]|uniref:hypothetical protein n=1 Tax=Burkholderia cepacia complex TaxID=87882 RepID=UPI000F0932FA|nr:MULTISPECIES: hypothetical protein [Burkholderia cepacia complex]AYQ38917.1 hypothetical protein CVS37_12995 [Burkholderia lata]